MMGYGKEECLINVANPRLDICRSTSWNTHGILMANTCLSKISPGRTCRSNILTMTEPPPPKRQRKLKKKVGGPISGDDPLFTSGAGTIERITTVDRSGRQTVKEVKVPLVLPTDKRENTSVYVREDPMEFAGGPYEDLNDEETVRPTGTRMVGLYYYGQNHVMSNNYIKFI